MENSKIFNLAESIKSLVMDEYSATIAKFGAANNSHHESYAIILEELEEAKGSTKLFEHSLDWFWDSVKQNTVTNRRLEEMQLIAEQTAAEWIQVAAMCYKAQKSKE